MSQVGKLVSEMEISASAEKYYQMFKDKCFHIPNISKKFIQEVKLHEDDWENHGHGSIKTWNYTVDGKPEVLKERVEFDDKNLVITLIGLEGDVFNCYKTFIPKYKIVPKGPKHSLIVLELEYEKCDDNSPYPYKYLDLMNGLTKDIESHLK